MGFPMNLIFLAQLVGIPAGLYCENCQKSATRARVGYTGYWCVTCKKKLIFYTPKEEEVFEYPSPT